MTDFSDLKSQIAEWSNRQDWTDVLVTSFIRMAEAKFNAELRVDRMIEFDDGVIVERCAPLPDDWLAMDLVRIANTNGADGFLPAEYKPRHDFFRWTDQMTKSFYTLEGRTMFFGGTPDPINGTLYKIAYYGEVPVFSDQQTSWVYSKYPGLYLDACLSFAALHAVGEEKSAANFKQLTEDQIQKLNANHLAAKASGSRVVRSRMRSFG